MIIKILTIIIIIIIIKIIIINDLCFCSAFFQILETRY